MNPRTGRHRRSYRRVHMLPSLLTLGNFACGFLSIVLCLNALFFTTAGAAAGAPGAEAMTARAGFLFHWACVLVFFGMLFDVMDGKVARAMRVTSEFGKELDSLADVASFGIAPAIIVNTLSLAVMPAGRAWWTPAIFCGVLFAVCAALRLARYNIQAGVADRNIFSGLPSPAAAGCVVSAVLLFAGNYPWLDSACALFAGNSFFGMDVPQVRARLLTFFLLVPGLLMVSTVPFSHAANRYLGGKKSFSLLVAAVLLLALVLYEPRLMLFLCFNGYLVLGLAAAGRNLLKGRPATVNYGGDDSHRT